MNKIAKWMTAVVSAALVAGSAVPVMAAPISGACVDTSKTGTLTIYKYDMTKAEEGGIRYGSFAASGEADEAAMKAMQAYAVEGVGFSYIKAADLFQETEVSIDGTCKTELLYGIDAEMKAVLESIGLDQKPEKTEAGLFYYESDSLNQALTASLASDMQGIQKENKNKLETFMASSEKRTDLPPTDENGKTAASGLDLGLYLVVQMTAETHECNTTLPFFVSLPMTDVTGDHWNYDVTVYPKSASSRADLKKEVAEITSAAAVTYSDTATASSDDLLHYRITSTLPTITSKAVYLTCYTFRDVMDAGLTYLNPEEKDVQLFWYRAGKNPETEEADAVWKQEEETARFKVETAGMQDGGSYMLITMTAAGLKEINEKYSDGKVVVDYGVRMNADETITVGDEGMPNEVTLTYKRTADTKEEVMRDVCRVYTYGLNLTKTFSDAKGDPQNVSFVVENQTDHYFVKAEKRGDGIYYAAESCVGRTEEEATVFVPSAEGTLILYGLEDDVYRAVETATDAEYLLLKEDIVLTLGTEIEEVMKDTDCTHKVHHKVEGTADVNGQETSEEDGLAKISVVNTRGFDIPETGESGAFLLPLAGMALASVMLAGGYILLKKN